MLSVFRVGPRVGWRSGLLLLVNRGARSLRRLLRVIAYHSGWPRRRSPAVIRIFPAHPGGATPVLRRTVPHLRSRRPFGTLQAQLRWRHAAAAAHERRHSRSP